MMRLEYEDELYNFWSWFTMKRIERDCMIVRRMKIFALEFGIPFVEIEIPMFVIHNCQRDEKILKPRQEREN
jgi:hypothetical protein